MKRWRHNNSTPRSGSDTTVPAAGAVERTTWWSKRRAAMSPAAGISTSTMASRTHSLS